MTREEATKIVDKCEAYVDLEVCAPSVMLDGDFTAQQLEAVLTLMRPFSNQLDSERRK